MKKEKLSKILLICIFVVFSIFVLVLAFKIRMGVSPDSSYHLEVSRVYSTTLGIPENSPDTYKWRDITRIPYLYYWINGRILNINNGFLDEIILLRLVNVIYSLGTVFVMYLLSKEVLTGKFKRLFPLFLLTNTLMFTFLSSSINYDNLANLLSVLSIFFFVKFVKSKISIKYLLLMILSLSLGAFTKFTILPLAFILVVLSIVEIIRKRKELKNLIFKKSYLFLLIPIVITLFFNSQIYGVNLIKYGSLEPECNQILTHEQCLENGVYYRDNVTMEETEIGGLKDSIDLVISGERIDFVRYFGYWIWDITGKIYGIMGDSSLIMSSTIIPLYLLFLSISLLLGVLNWKKWNRTEIYLIVISLFYFLVLFFVQNYDMYLRYNHLYLALQGRYMFPVITVIYILFSKSIFFIKNKWVRNTVLVLLILLFIYGCIPYFVLNVEPWWFKSV